ncbi:MAG TPA: peroxiredoxin family protein [bacterium]|jgi:peroxiredoxin
MSQKLGAFLAIMAVILIGYAMIRGNPEMHTSSAADLRPTIPADALKASEGQPAPDFTYFTIDGDEVRLSEYRGEKSLVLYFWETADSQCRSELPALRDFYKENHDSVEIIAITSERLRNIENIRSVVTGEVLPFKVLHDHDGSIAELFPHTMIPFTVYIDSNGTVIKMASGYNNDVIEDIRITLGTG